MKAILRIYPDDNNMCADILQNVHWFSIFFSVLTAYLDHNSKVRMNSKSSSLKEAFTPYVLALLRLSKQIHLTKSLP